MRIKNFPSVESIDGSQDALVIEQTDGDVDKSRKVSPAQIKQYVLNDMDEVPTEDSENPVKSGGVFSELEKCWKLDAGTVIPDNSDLNNYKTPGNYYHLTANVSTVSNIPDNKGFRLTVLLDLYDPAFVEQIFNPIGSYKIYKRYYSTSNAWTDWKVVEDVIGDLSQTGLTGDSVADQLTDAGNKFKRLNNIKVIDEDFVIFFVGYSDTANRVLCPINFPFAFSGTDYTLTCSKIELVSIGNFTTGITVDTKFRSSALIILSRTSTAGASCVGRAHVHISRTE